MLISSPWWSVLSTYWSTISTFGIFTSKWSLVRPGLEFSSFFFLHFLSCSQCNEIKRSTWNQHLKWFSRRDWIFLLPRFSEFSITKYWVYKVFIIGVLKPRKHISFITGEFFFRWILSLDQIFQSNLTMPEVSRVFSIRNDCWNLFSIFQSAEQRSSLSLCCWWWG